MNDRELLEMAAKAAGIVVHAPGQKLRDDIGYGHVGLWTEETTCWNPLTDDGDALRLAATCHMVLDWSGSELHVRFWLTQSPEAPTLTFKSSDCGGDKATIVRAAAEIGRSIASASEAAPNGEKP